MRAEGFSSQIFTASAPRHLRHLVRDVRALPAAERTWILYQCSTGAPIADALYERARAADRRLPQHHAGPVLRPVGATDRERARRGASADGAPRRTAPCSGSPTPRSTGPSSTERGYARQRWLPILLDFASLRSPRRPPRARPPATRQGERRSGLAVRRPARTEQGAARHRARRSPRTDGATTRRPVCTSWADRRRTSLRTRHCELRSPRSASATACECPAPCVGRVLAAYYRTADVFVCLSDHEGFCVPLLEAMHHGLPDRGVRGRPPSPRRSASGGLCLPDKEPLRSRHAVSRVLTRGLAARHLVRCRRAAGPRLRPRLARARSSRRPSPARSASRA